MSEKKGVFGPQEIQLGRHYWFTYRFEEFEVDCVIKVMSISKNFIFWKILDTQTLMIFFSTYISPEEEERGEEEAGEGFEILAEHLIREVTADEMKFLVEKVEESTKDFFSAILPAQEVGSDKKHRLH